VNSNIEFRKKRETGLIIQDTLAFLKSEHKSLIRLIAVYVLPFMALYAANQVFQFIQITESGFSAANINPERMAEEMSGFIGNLTVSVLFNVFVQSLLVAVVYSYIQVYLDKGKGNFTYSDISSILFANSLKSVSAGFIVALLAGFGLFFFIIPGIIIANSLSLTIFVAIFENTGPAEAIQRSWKLVKQRWWGTFALNITGVMVVYLVSITISIPGYIFDIFHNSQPDGISAPVTLPGWRLAIMGLTLTVSSIATIVPVIFLAFQYFNLKAQESDEISNQ
jgi:hypothetical protein